MTEVWITTRSASKRKWVKSSYMVRTKVEQFSTEQTIKKGFDKSFKEHHNTVNMRNTSPPNFNLIFLLVFKPLRTSARYPCILDLCWETQKKVYTLVYTFTYVSFVCCSLFWKPIKSHCLWSNELWIQWTWSRFLLKNKEMQYIAKPPWTSELLCEISILLMFQVGHGKIIWVHHIVSSKKKIILMHISDYFPCIRINPFPEYILFVSASFVCDRGAENINLIHCYHCLSMKMQYTFHCKYTVETF